ncbi:MAG: hypothetical protein A3K61_03730 [Thaumarchaeota archaeon RBG_16_49_8]|nr:hypothetical protein [Nitrososphaerota archaeon]OHE55793.1 MAG: hypothetical protein A3K61_03730 [Thaumarchaeota archaeon RBG_16_49_8]
MESSSTSRITAKIIVHGKGEASADLFRHLSPMTLNAIMLKMPIHGRVNRIGESLICIITSVVAGTEKSKTTFEQGAITFLPLNGSICIFLKPGKSARPLNQIGSISSGLETLLKAGNGDTITITITTTTPPPNFT